MNCDFSQVNLQYLIQARDLAKRDPSVVSTLLAIPIEMAKLLAEVSPRELAHVALIKPPLLVPHQETWWWARLFTAIREGRVEEIEAIAEHAPLITLA